MHEIIVRTETPEDIRAIDVVHLSAFQGETEAQLISALRESPKYIPELSLVAELNGRIVGHLLLSKLSLTRDGWKTAVFALGPMAVVPSQSHRGIGSELIKAAIAKAREYGCSGIVVAGHPEYYQRFGFSQASDWGVHCNLEIPKDAFTAMELAPGTLTDGGEVEYPSVFADVF